MTKIGDMSAGTFAALQAAERKHMPRSFQILEHRKQKNQIQRDLKKGLITDKEARSKLNMLNMVDENTTHEGGPSLMATLGRIAGDQYQTWRQRDNDRYHHAMSAGDRLNNLLNQGAARRQATMAPFHAQIMQNAAPVGGGVGAGFNMGSPFQMPMPPMPMANPLMGMGMQNPFMNMPNPFANPFMGMGGMAMPNPFMNMGMQNPFMNANMQNTMQGTPLQHSSNPYHNNSFVPGMSNTENAQNNEKIMLGDFGPFNIPKKAAEELDKLKEKFENCDSLAQRAKYLDRVTSIIRKKVAPNNKNPELYTGDFLRDMAYDYLRDGMEPSEEDRRLESLVEAGIGSPKDIEKLEQKIDVHTVNTYVNLLKQLGRGDSIGEAVARLKIQNDNVVPDGPKRQIIYALGANNAERGMHADQFQLLDDLFRKRGKGISIEDMSATLIDAVGGANSAHKSRQYLSQEQDPVMIEINASGQGEDGNEGIYGSILPTSEHASFINGLIGGNSESEMIGLKLGNVTYEEGGLYHGDIGITDSNGNTAYYRLSDIQSEASEEFNEIFKSIYHAFKGKTADEGYHAAPGIQKYQLGKLKRFMKLKKIKPIPSNQFGKDPVRAADEAILEGNGLGAPNRRSATPDDGAKMANLMSMLGALGGGSNNGGSGDAG